MNKFFAKISTLRNIGALRKLCLNFTGLISRKGGRSLIVFAIKLGRLSMGQLSSGKARSIAVFILACGKIQRKQGVRGLVIYLKTSQVLLMKIVGGDHIASTLALGCKVGRDRKGYPLLINSLDRKAIRRGDDRTLRLWMSLLGLYRVLEFKGRVGTSTITAPSVATLEPIMQSFVNFTPVFLSSLAKISKVWGRLISIPVERGVRATEAIGETVPFFIPTASPIKLAGPVPGIRPNSTSFLSLIASAIAWETKDEVEKSAGIPKEERLLTYLKEFCYATNQLWVFQLIRAVYVWNSAFTNDPLTKEKNSDKRWDQFDPDTSQLSYLGSLALKDEPAGKVRVFALVDCFTQWALKGLHNCIFSILRDIPQDGTFDQTKPLMSLFRENNRTERFFSMDLSAATDRLPVNLQRDLLGAMFGERIANAWRGLLVSRDYVLRAPGRLEKKTVVRYSVGQPMGAYSSWALLALFHHFIVQWAYYRVCLEAKVNYAWYTRYAILGDDVIISGNRVATEYRLLLRHLGAPINLFKSILGVRPVGEFAKKFVVSGIDCSPISWKEASIASRNFLSALQLVFKTKCGIGPFLSLVSVGPFAKTHITKPWNKLSLRLESYVSMFNSPIFNSSSWISWFLRTSQFTSIKAEDDVLRYTALSFTKYCVAEAKKASHKSLASMTGETIELPAWPYPHEGAVVNADYYARFNKHMKQEALLSLYDDFTRASRLLRNKTLDKFLDNSGPIDELLSGAIDTYLLGCGVPPLLANTDIFTSPTLEAKLVAEQAHRLFLLRRTFLTFLTEAKARKKAGLPLTQGRIF